MRADDPARSRSEPVSSSLAPARWFSLAIVALVPWAYGCSRSWIIPWFTGALLVNLALWIGGLIVRGRRPAGSPFVFALVACLLLQGWLLAVNAGYRYDRETLRFESVRPVLAASLPGAIDAANALSMLGRITGLLGLLLIAMDAARHARWRRHLFWTMVGSSTLLTLYGLVQKAAAAPFLFWTQAEYSYSLFATFYYHGNAGAFVNLLLPFVFGAAVYGFDPARGPGMRAFGVATLFLNVAAAVAIASKAAQIVTVILLVALVASYRRELLLAAGWGTRKQKVPWLPAVALGVLCLGALALAGDGARRRWDELPLLLSVNNPRIVAYRACLRILPDAGCWGIGPGNFAIAFPHYTHGLPDAVRGVWQFAHEDYLQTVIEWGWVGAFLWTALFFGGWWRGRPWRARVGQLHVAAGPEDTIIYRSARLALCGVALHALVDFPLQIGAIQTYVMVCLGLLWWLPVAPTGRDVPKAARSARLTRPVPLPAS